MTEETFDNLFDAQARVAAIYPIALLGDVENPPKWLVEFAENHNDVYVGEIIASHPELKNIDPESFLCEKELAQVYADRWCSSGRQGFIAFVEVCIRRYQNGGPTFFSGWGYLQLAWLYCEKIDDILPQTLELASRLDVAAMRRSQDRAGA